MPKQAHFTLPLWWVLCCVYLTTVPVKERTSARHKCTSCSLLLVLSLPFAQTGQGTCLSVTCVSSWYCGSKPETHCCQCLWFPGAHVTSREKVYGENKFRKRISWVSSFRQRRQRRKNKCPPNIAVLETQWHWSQVSWLKTPEHYFKILCKLCPCL